MKILKTREMGKTELLSVFPAVCPTYYFTNGIRPITLAFLTAVAIIFWCWIQFPL